MTFTQSEATAARRRFPIYLVDATDGLTPETGEAAGQPQISKNGGSWTNTSATLTAVGNGAYYVELTTGELDTLGSIAVRYKSSATAEFSRTATVIAANLHNATNLGLSNLNAPIAFLTGTSQTNASPTTYDVKLAAGALTGKNVVGCTIDIGGRFRRITAADSTTHEIQPDSLTGLSPTDTTYAYTIYPLIGARIDGDSQSRIEQEILEQVPEALDTDANGRVRIVSGTGAGELDFTSGIVKANTVQVLGTAVDASPTPLDTNVVSIANNVITTAAIADGAFTAAKFATGFLTADKIASDAITAAKIANDAITSAKLANGAITADKVAANAIGASQLADNAITAAKIGGNAITSEKLAPNAIGAVQIADNAIGASEIADNAITAAKLATDAGNKIADALLDRTVDGVAVSKILQLMLAQGFNELGVSESGGTVTLTFYARDGSTTIATLPFTKATGARAAGATIP